jgi:hypothetical protein
MALRPRVCGLEVALRSLGRPVLRAQQVQQVLSLDLQALQVLQARPGLPVLKVRQATSQDRQDPQVLRVRRGLRELRVRQGPLGRRDF